MITDDIRTRELKNLENTSTAPENVAYIFQDRKGVEFMPENMSTRKEFLVEDDWMLLMSAKGQTAHQNLLTNPSAFFLPRFVINTHAVLSDTPFTGWGTATCLRSAALSRTRLVAKSLSL
eukprot:symbB.v1.2.032346.t1/scaffold3875.1/size48969/1